jgi:hypothetical protein
MLRLLSLLAAVVSAALAQSSNTADLEGLITDPAGAVIAGARLTVKNRETGVVRTGETNHIGRYRVAALPAGEYELTVSKEGFATSVRTGLALRVGQVATVDVQLPVAAQSEKVTVTEAVPIVETGRATVGAVVDRNEIENLPINGRNFLDYSRTVAGVTAQQTSGQGSGLSFNGQRGRSNNLSIDGVDNNGQLNANTRLTLSQDAVREFQVVTNMFAPEFGNAAGGLVNVVSRSGTNDFHGNAFFFLRDESMDGRNAFVTDAEKPPFRRKNSGATLGGPILRNRTFFFASVEYISRHESDVVTISDANVRAINAVLAARPIPRAGVTAISNGTFPVDRIDTLSSLKLDHTFGAKDTVTFRYLFGQSRESNAGGVGIGGTTDVSGGGGQRDRDQSFLGAWTHVFSPTLLTEGRFQYAPRALTQYDNDPIGPRVQISGVANWGRNVNFPVLLDEARYQWQQSFSKQYGRHFIKFGSDINWIRAHTSFPVNFAGTFSFSNLTDFQNGRVNQFTQGFGNPEIRLPDTLLGFYLQDSFKLSDRLTLTYGLRYDYDMQPQGIPRDRSNPIEAPLQDGVARDPNNVAPRIGLTWNPEGKGKTVVRAGYGLFYDKIFLLVARNALIARQTLTLASALATPQLAQGAFPESVSYPTGFSLPKGSLNMTDPNLALPYGVQANFGVEREVARDWSVGATWVMVHGVHQLRSENQNLGAPTVLTLANAASLGVARPTPQQIGRRIYPSLRLNPNFTNIQVVNTSASSIYHGLQLSLQKRLSHGFQTRINYTFSKTLDDASDFTQALQPQDPYNKRAEKALSTEHQAHRFTLTGLWELPFKRSAAQSSAARWVLGDWVLATNWAFRSGTPNNVTVGGDTNLDGNSNDRPFNGSDILGRNTFLGPASYVIDARLSKRIPVRERVNVLVLVEAFNIQNRVNLTDPNTTWGTELTPSASFGQFRGAANPRQVQLGFKVSF